MANSGVMASFLPAMTQIRAQRLREELAKDEAMSDLGAGIGQGISSLAGSVTGAMKQGKMDNMANSLMNQSVPRAQAVNPAAQGPADATAAGMPGMFTGGIDELKLRQSMGQFSEGNRANLIKDMQMRMQMGRYGMAKQAAARAAQVAKEKGAQDAFSKLAKGDKEFYNASDAYIKGAPVLFEKINNAQTQEEYDVYAGQLRNLNALANKRGLEVEQIRIPAFMRPEEKRLLAEHEQAVQSGDADAIEAAGQAMTGMSMPPSAAPVQAVHPSISNPQSMGPQTPNMAGSNPSSSNTAMRPPGSRAQDPVSKKWYIWNGNAFVEEK